MGENKCVYCNENRTEELITSADGNSFYHPTCYRINKMETFLESYGGDEKEFSPTNYFSSPSEMEGHVEIKKCIICNEDKKEPIRRYKENAFLPIHDSCTLTATPQQKDNATKAINNQKKLMEGISDLSKLNSILGNSLRAFDKKKSEGPVHFGETFKDVTRKEVNFMIQGNLKDNNKQVESNAKRQGREIPHEFINSFKDDSIPNIIEDNGTNKPVGMSIISPNLGDVDSFPCWFCGKHEGEMLFDTEFDTPLHEACLRKELDVSPDNPEAQIMKYLLD